MLKDWLNRALAVALEEESATLTARHLERQAAPARKLLSLAREIQEGEASLREGGREHEELRRLLGLCSESMPGETLASRPAATSGGPSPASRRQAARVAERLPSRDPVGVGGGEHAD